MLYKTHELGVGNSEVQDNMPPEQTVKGHVLILIPVCHCCQFCAIIYSGRIPDV